ncbi:MAG: hypothetical protein ABI700_00460 [Chloroflexota bacterium]
MNQADRQLRVAHVCPGCGRVRRLKPADAAKTRKCLRCHCQEIAPLGFAATAARKGRDFAIRAAARKRKQCPSSLEQRVEAALSEIPGITWEREFTVERPNHNPYFVDFAVVTSKYRIALEVNGTYVHRNDGDSLRYDTLFLYFDDVIVLKEADIQRAPDLGAVLQHLLA